MAKGTYPLTIHRNWRRRYYWKVTAPNGERIGKSEQTFASRLACAKNWNLLNSLAQIDIDALMDGGYQ